MIDALVFPKGDDKGSIFLRGPLTSDAVVWDCVVMSGWIWTVMSDDVTVGGQRLIFFQQPLLSAELEKHQLL